MLLAFCTSKFISTLERVASHVYVTLYFYTMLLFIFFCPRVNLKSKIKEEGRLLLMLKRQLFYWLLGVLVDTGGILKVTSFDESNKSINNAFDKAIADHADKMKRQQEQNKQDEESKLMECSLKTPDLLVRRFLSACQIWHGRPLILICIVLFWFNCFQTKYFTTWL